MNKKLLHQEPGLIKRYVRLRMHNNAKCLSRLIMRQILTYKERKRKKVLTDTVAEIAKQLARTRRHGLETLSAVFNLGLFFLIAEKDIQTVKIDALTHPDPWRRSLCARIILLTIHELDMDKVSGGKLRIALENAGVSEGLKLEYTQALRCIRNSQQKAQKKFAFLRNNTIAHRDSDALLQFQSIAKIDEMEVLQIAGEFYTSTHKFLDVIPRLVVEVSQGEGYLTRYVAK